MRVRVEAERVVLGDGSAGRRLLEHVRTPLHRDGYALAGSSAFTAVAGMLYWIVAAKSYDAHAVGINSALISSMMFLAGIAGLNLPNIVVRFLPGVGRRTTRVIAGAYALTAVAAILAIVVFALGVGEWAPRLRFLRSDGALLLWFGVSTVAWSLFVIQDSVLTALDRAVWVTVENAVFSLVKLGLLVAAAVLLPVYGIFVSWTVGMLGAVAVVNTLIFARLARRPRASAPDATFAPRDRAFRRYFAADYVISIAWVSATNLMPVIVTAVAGATTNAYYALAWAVAVPLYALVMALSTALLLHGTRDPAALPALARKAGRQAGMVVVPLVVGMVALAPWLLRLFGAQYADHSTTLLRLLVAGVLPYLALSLTMSMARVRRRLRPAVAALIAQAVLALGSVAPLLHALGVVGAGVAWLGSLSIVALALGVRELRGLGRAGS
jgi:O-antigen/teichoic acid export membrane protein